MALKPGTRLGPYEIRALLGAGGMGEVYQGWDTRLDRLVAIKILPAHLADRPDLRERFEREAKATANLKHPNICVLYDVGRQVLEAEDQSRERERPVISGSPEHSWPEEAKEAKERHTQRPAGLSRAESRDRRTVHFLVMEYLEGETLSARLKRGPLPLEQVLQFAAEISDALDKAHRQGYVHRDIKPGNIMLVPSTALPSTGLRTGGAGAQSTSGSKTATKLLDFGLAKFKQEIVKATLPASEMPTVPGTLTEHGTLLGTLHYMAPEQVESKDVDSRADLFAFGAVVYEMATGKKAFDGESQASVIAKILEVEPPAMSSLDPPGQLSPPALDRLVKKCLRKDREDRWQSARDVTDELKWVKEGGGAAAAATVTEAKPRQKGWRRMLPVSMTAMIAAVVAVAVGIGVWNLKPSAPPGGSAVANVTVPLPPGDQLAGLDLPSVALSPDGTQLAYVGIRGGIQQLYVRVLDSLEAKAIPGTEGATAPFFSPDGQWIGFFAQGKLKKVSVTGGSLQALADAPFGVGGSWGPDDTIYFAPLNITGLSKVSDSGGQPQEVTRLDRGKGEVSHRWPQVLPGGRAVLFDLWTGPGFDESHIAVHLLETGEQRVLVRGGETGRYVSTGHLVYSRAGTLMAVPFDLARLEVGSNPPVPLVEGVRRRSEGAQYALSASGALAYIAGGSQWDESRLIWVDRRGSVELLPAPQRAYFNPRLAPDGRRLAVQVQEGTIGIWMYDLARATLTRLTSEGSSQAPVWAPDGRRIAYRATRTGFRNVYWRAADGTGVEERLTMGEGIETPSSMTPDGRFLAFVTESPGTGEDIWALPLEGERKPQVLVRSSGLEEMGAISPDGHWIAYSSDESGRFEVYAQPFPGPGAKSQVSTEGGTEPVWARNGRELFYRNGDRIMAVDVTTQPGFTAGSPRSLFEGRYEFSPNGVAGYDVSLDGLRFLMVQPVEPEQPATQINVVLNWFEELRRRVPATQ